VDSCSVGEGSETLGKKKREKNIVIFLFNLKRNVIFWFNLKKNIFTTLLPFLLLLPPD